MTLPRINHVTLGYGAIQAMRSFGLPVQQGTGAPFFPNGSSSLSFQSNCGKTSCNGLDLREVIHFSHALIVDTNVGCTTTKCRLSNDYSFSPYWLEGVIVGRNAPLPPGKWISGSAIQAACIVAQIPDIPYARGEHNPPDDYFSSMALRIRGEVVLRPGNEDDRHGKLYIPETYYRFQGCRLRAIN